MVSELSPQFFGQPEMSAQDFFDSRIINSEVGSDGFQSVYASPLSGIGALVDHKDSVRCSLSSVGAKKDKGRSRSDLSSVVEGDFDRKFFEGIVDEHAVTYKAAP